MQTNPDPEIVAAEERLTAATQSLDVEALDRIYADDIMFTGVTGAICTKDSVMDEARRGAAARQAASARPTGPTVVSYTKDDIRAVRHGDTGVASFRFGVTVRAEDKEVTRHYRTTNVWLKRGGAWQVVAAHTATLG